MINSEINGNLKYSRNIEKKSLVQRYSIENNDYQRKWLPNIIGGNLKANFPICSDKWEKDEEIKRPTISQSRINKDIKYLQ